MRKGQRVPDEMKERIAAKLALKWSFTNPAGEKVTFWNLEKFCRDNGLQPQNMVRVLLGEYKQHKGFTKP